MANSLIHSSKNMRRMESRKSHSWWWDSHVSPKNSKWLAENLEEMDKSVKRMLKLIEEEGDSFAKKAEMYYQKRPELVSHVEEFYRMYRSLAERYDHVTGELRKNIPSELQSQGSNISDSGSDLTTAWPSPDQRLGRRRSGTRAAGFDFFLGSGGGSDSYQKGDDESSTLTDSEAESDDSSINNYSVVSGNGSDQSLQRKIVELEIELRIVKDKLRARQEDSTDGLSRGLRNDYEYEQELRLANEKLRNSEEEIFRLKIALQNTGPKSLELNGSDIPEEFDRPEEARHSDDKIQALVQELRIAKGRLQVSENEITSLRYELERNKSPEKIRQLQNQLESAQKEIITWKSKINAEKREVSKLQERISRLKSSLSDRDSEIMDLKIAVSDAEQKIFPEKAHVKAEISKLLEENVNLVEQLREMENQGRCFEEEIRNIKAERSETEAKLSEKLELLNKEAVEREDAIESLNKSFASMKTERDGLSSIVSTLDKQLFELKNKRDKLIAETEEAHKIATELESRTAELEKEIERQRVQISDGAEEKREAIRQLCFSIDHYRNGYNTLRLAFYGHKRMPILTS